jgi:hypothetical protein
MSPPEMSKAAPARAGSGLRIPERFGRLLNPENILAPLRQQAQKLAAFLAAIDPAHVAVIGALFSGEAR